MAQRLLTNIYRAFDFRDDSDVYDALATSVDGELLKDVYLTVKRSLLMAEQGGALSHVTGVEIVKLSPAGGAASVFDVTWRVIGTVEHWGHIHTRVNEYRARLTLSAGASGWRLTNHAIEDERLVRLETGLRGSAKDRVDSTD